MASVHQKAAAFDELVAALGLKVYVAFNIESEEWQNWIEGVRVPLTLGILKEAESKTKKAASEAVNGKEADARG